MDNLYFKITKQKNIDNCYPLSFGQERLWLIDQLGSGSPQYNLVNLTLITGDFKKKLLEDTLALLIEKHESLRTIFVFQNERTEQVILPTVKLSLEYVDLRKLNQVEQRRQIDLIVEKENRHIFDLASGPLLKTILLHLGEREYIFLLNIHHIIADAWSIQLLLQEIIKGYMALRLDPKTNLAPLNIQFKDYAVWQRKCFAEGLFAAEIEYWQRQLMDSPALLQLPTDFSRPKVQSFDGSVYRFELKAELVSSIVRLCHQKKVTMFMILLTCFKILLHRYTQEEDILVGVPISGRNNYDLESLIGVFTNTLVLRTDLSGNPTFEDLLKKMVDVTMDAYDHQNLPFEKLIEIINPQRETSYSPLFQVFFSFFSRQIDDFRLEDLLIEPLSGKRYTSKFDLSFEIEECKGRVDIGIEYCVDLFTEQTIGEMARYYQSILSTVLDNPEIQISAIPMLTDREIEEIIYIRNQTDVEYPENLCIHQLFERQVRKHPTRTAIEYQDKSITYGELDWQADLVANGLRQLGVLPEEPIAICLQPGIDLITAILGVFKAGCCYVPLDPDFPLSRVKTIVKDAAISVMLTISSQEEKLPQSMGLTFICVDGDRDNPSPEMIDDYSKVASTNLAYIIYTSGSTGVPKGVEIEHKSVVNFLTAMKLESIIESEDTLLSVTSFTFDISVLEMFLPLVSGAKVILLDRDDCQDGLRLKQKIEDYQPKIIQATPSTWRLLLKADWQGDARSLKILSGGEVLTRQLAAELIKRGKTVWNLYGPTETTIWSTIHKVTGDENEIPIGKPLANTKVYVLDKNLNPLPPGVVGDIYISGDGVARGYRNRPEETARRFLDDKFSPGLSMYATGDQGRYDRDGLIYFSGRKDSQFKIRGYRIEAEEIESQIRKFPNITNCIVLSKVDHTGEQNIVAYIEGKHGTNIDVEEVRGFVKTGLPEYMIPRYYVVLDKFPLMINGKVNRQQLPLPEVKAENSYVAPTDEFEKQMVEIWEKTLNIQPIGIYDDFFALGGNSLMGTVIISRIKDVFHVDIPLKTIFEERNVSQLIQIVVNLQLKSLSDDDLEEMLNEIE